jgi:hypothetical protein
LIERNFANGYMFSPKTRESAMPIASISRFDIPRAEATRILQRAAPMMKAKGVTSIHHGFCYSGAQTGESTVTLIYKDWETFAKVTDALAQDKDYQKLFAEVLEVGELLDRSIMIVQDY